MSTEQFQSLLRKAAEDSELQQRLKDAGNTDAALAVAREAGFDVNQADVIEYQTNLAQRLSDDQVGDISGGNDVYESAWRTNNYAPNWP